MQSASGVSVHVPYRESKLTKLLMDSIGGNALALMVACVTPGTAHIEETMNTLLYATRAKAIRNSPSVQFDPNQGLVTALRQELELLRNENEYLRSMMVHPACFGNSKLECMVQQIRFADCRLRPLALVLFCAVCDCLGNAHYAQTL